MSADNLSVLRQQVNMLRQVVSDLIELQRTTPAAQPVLAQLDALQERVRQMQSTEDEDTRLCVKEVTIERLNVAEPDGTVRLVLCNTPHSPGHVMDGKVIGKQPGERDAGVYFFDDEGNECGGLIYGGKREADGAGSAFGSLTFDQYRQDQVIEIQRGDENLQHWAHFRIWDRAEMPIDAWVDRCIPIFELPEGPAKEEAIQQLKADGLLAALRVSVGKNTRREAVISLHDAQGRVRLRLCVDAEGTPKLEFLDENGTVFSRFPNQG